MVFDCRHRAVLVGRPVAGRAALSQWEVPWSGRGAVPGSADPWVAGAGLSGGAMSRPVHVGSVRGMACEGDGNGGRGGDVELYFAETGEPVLPCETPEGRGPGVFSIEKLRHRLGTNPSEFSPLLRFLVPRLGPFLIRLPYLSMRESDYIYRFRTGKQRNPGVYRVDGTSRSLYQSTLCEAIKAVKRTRERSPDSPATLDFGPVQYLLPSHFGFCLGVQNAIERAYECLAENPGRPVYMLSELIHNPFVNDDLLRRGLRYLQTDKGEAVRNPETGRPFWEEIGGDDIVVIPAFGATNEDKTRLIEKGIAINHYDATCMLVEKVWKTARRFGAEGYTVIIHGKSEHEETKATFSNAAAAGPCLVIRNLEEARVLGEIIRLEGADAKRERFRFFEDRHTPGFLPERDLRKVAVVNQTTLLRNETLAIIEYLEEVLAEKYGTACVGEHLHSGSKGDTLCYATQVNQNALEQTLGSSPDLAVVVGGENSSNTFQLFRMCERELGANAFYIQSEENIRSRDRIRHYVFPSGSEAGRFEERPFLPSDRPRRILVTGGASCPDGLIQQVITRINGFFEAEGLRPAGDVLAEIGG